VKKSEIRNTFDRLKNEDILAAGASSNLPFRIRHGTILAAGASCNLPFCFRHGTILALSPFSTIRRLRHLKPFSRLIKNAWKKRD